MTPKNIPEQVLPQLPDNFRFKRWSDGTVMIRTPNSEQGDKYYWEDYHRVVADVGGYGGFRYPRYILEKEPELLSFEEAVRRCVSSGLKYNQINLLDKSGQVARSQYLASTDVMLGPTVKELLTPRWVVVE